MNRVLLWLRLPAPTWACGFFPHILEMTLWQPTTLGAPHGRPGTSLYM